jgi:hypothetical protein
VTFVLEVSSKPGGVKVKGFVGYVMRYYTIWLVLVKSSLVPFLGIGEWETAYAVEACDTGSRRTAGAASEAAWRRIRSATSRAISIISCAALGAP